MPSRLISVISLARQYYRQYLRTIRRWIEESLMGLPPIHPFGHINVYRKLWLYGNARPWIVLRFRIADVVNLLLAFRHICERRIPSGPKEDFLVLWPLIF
jgi:hypothetical protein